MSHLKSKKITLLLYFLFTNRKWAISKTSTIKNIENFRHISTKIRSISFTFDKSNGWATKRQLIYLGTQFASHEYPTNSKKLLS